MHSKYGIFTAVFLCCIHLVAPSRVVQLIAENPSPFVSANPDDPRHIVTVFDDVATAAEMVPAPSSFRSTIMTDADGQQYNCSLPSVASWHATALARKTATQLDPGMSPATHFKTPFELLESLTGLCLYRQDGLWTYEVCHRKHVRQFRQETGKKGEDFSCGQYTGDEQQSEAILEDTSSSGHPLKYVSHSFSGGAKCVLTGQPRTAEVRYTCVRDTADNVVLSVREFPTCNYVVVVSTPFLCRHHQFVPQEEDLRLVSCVPLGPGTAARKQPSAASSAALAAGDKQQQPGAPAHDKKASKHAGDAASSRSPREDDEPLLLQIDDTAGYFDDSYTYNPDEYLERDAYDESYGQYEDGSAEEESAGKKSSPHEEL